MPKTIILLCVACVLFSSSNATSQENKLDYLLRFKYPVNIFFVYSCTEQTHVARKLSTGDTSSFNRKSQLFFTFRENDLPNDGFQKIEVKTDSLNHFFESKKNKWEFNSNRSDIIATWNEDLEQYQIPLSRTFTYSISPYYEFADLKPDEPLQGAIKTIDEPRTKLEGADYVLWKNSLSDERFYHLTDMKKVEFPAKKIEMFSVWSSPIEFQVSGVTFYDTVNVKLVEEKGGYLFLEAKFKPKRFVKDSVVVYGYRDQAVAPKSADLDCTFNLTVTPYNTIDEAKITAVGSIIFSGANKLEFTDKIDSKYFWLLNQQYNY